MNSLKVMFEERLFLLPKKPINLVKQKKVVC